MVAHVDTTVIAGLKDFMGDQYPVLLDAYLVDSDQRMAQAEQAVAEHDMAALNRAIHSFKGSCGNIGALELARLCLELEQAVDQQNQPEIHRCLTQLKTELIAVKRFFLVEIQRSST